MSGSGNFHRRPHRGAHAARPRVAHRKSLTLLARLPFLPSGKFGLSTWFFYYLSKYYALIQHHVRQKIRCRVNHQIDTPTIATTAALRITACSQLPDRNEP